MSDVRLAYPWLARLALPFPLSDRRLSGRVVAVNIFFAGLAPNVSQHITSYVAAVINNESGIVLVALSQLAAAILQPADASGG